MLVLARCTGREVHARTVAQVSGENGAFLPAVRPASTCY